jgi:hypothetical protein
MSHAKANEMIRTLMLALVISVGCGGKDKAAPGTTPAAGGHAEHEGGEHAGMSPEMTRFHDLLRPLWHAEKGEARVKNTCDATPQFHTESDAVARATPPDSANADTWTAGTRALVGAVGELTTVCKGTDSAAFEAALGKVHDAFHALMLAAGAHGGGGMDGGDHDVSASAPPAEHHHDHGGH